MNLKVVKQLYYYEIPTLLICEDEKQFNYLFVLLDEETEEYIGHKVDAEHSGNSYQVNLICELFSMTKFLVS